MLGSIIGGDSENSSSSDGKKKIRESCCYAFRLCVCKAAKIHEYLYRVKVCTAWHGIGTSRGICRERNLYQCRFPRDDRYCISLRDFADDCRDESEQQCYETKSLRGRCCSDIGVFVFCCIRQSDRTESLYHWRKIDRR